MNDHTGVIVQYTPNLLPEFRITTPPEYSGTQPEHIDMY
jgi:hypothetical protein